MYMPRIPIHLNPTFPYTGLMTEANGVKIFFINFSFKEY